MIHNRKKDYQALTTRRNPSKKNLSEDHSSNFAVFVYYCVEELRVKGFSCV